MSGEVLTGLSHGVAGMAYFLVEHAGRTGAADSKRAAERALTWLAQQLRRDERGQPIGWAYGDQHEQLYTWWNHGAPGIAYAFLRAYEHFGDRSHADLAIAALATVPPHMCSASLGMGQGIAGVADVLLEASRVLDQPRRRTQAIAIAQTLHCMGMSGDGGVTWLVEDRLFPTADLMVGCGGIVHLFLRLCASPEFGPPLMLAPRAI
jgi:lantibiotic modifying enzyme